MCPVSISPSAALGPAKTGRSVPDADAALWCPRERSGWVIWAIREGLPSLPPEAGL